MNNGLIFVNNPESCDNCDLCLQQDGFYYCSVETNGKILDVNDYVVSRKKPFWCKINKVPETSVVERKGTRVILVNFDHESCSVHTIGQYIDALKNIFNKDTIIAVPKNISIEFLNQNEALNMVNELRDKIIMANRQN